MSKPQYLRQIVGAAAAALLLGASPLYAQPAASDAKSDTAKAAGAKVSKADQKMMADIARANISEIETGKLALEKSQNDEVKKFAQRMVDDHTSALKELQDLAQPKGVSLPTQPDAKHQASLKKLKTLSGAAFDKQYMAEGGVADHQRTVKELQKVEKSAKDPDLKAYAAKVLPIVEEHLKEAKQIVGKM